MNVLIIGSGGREHAIADAFSRSSKTQRIFVSPGNAGIEQYFHTVKLDSHSDILEFCIAQSIGLVFVGPETSIEQGLGDYLRLNNIAVVAPTKAAGRIESSKVFAKSLMQQYGIPTANFCIAHDVDSAIKCIEEFEYPIVIKADGLAAGKGVVIVEDYADAVSALNSMMQDKRLGDAANSIVLEEFMHGWEVSLFAFCDGTNFQTTIFSQDHKQLLDGDRGPNTGGMGAYAPVPEAEVYRKEIETSIIEPTLKALRDMGTPFEGVLYCGLMITKFGPKVVEFNCRLGDPETQAVLPLLKTDFYEVCRAIIEKKIKDLRLDWVHSHSICVVLASEGYPDSYNKGYEITIGEGISSKLFFAGVSMMSDQIQTAGGRVLCLVSTGKDLQSARRTVYDDVSKLGYTGMIFRSDIGLRNNRRWI